MPFNGLHPFLLRAVESSGSIYKSVSMPFNGLHPFLLRAVESSGSIYKSVSMPFKRASSISTSKLVRQRSTALESVNAL